MLDDFMNDLNGGFQGAGMGAQLLGGMSTAGIGTSTAFDAAGKATTTMNPWLAGGILAGTTALGALNANDPAKKRAGRLNEHLGQQELEMGDLDIKAKKNSQALEAERRRAWERFGGMFSGYISSMMGAR